MNRILRESGIRNRLTAPYTPQQNGIAERKNRTLIEPARCLLIDSGLPTSFWGEAVSTACYVLNRCITKPLGNETPHERWTERRPDVRHFRKFGEKVFFLDKSPNKDKLRPRGIEGIFVGYSTVAKAYRIWVPTERKIRITRDVQFMGEFSTQVIRKDPVIALEREFLLDQGKDRNSDDPVGDVPLDDPNHVVAPEIPQEIPNNEKRGPGRPAKVKTGKRGRPSKRYKMIAIDPSRNLEHDESTESSEGESQHETDIENDQSEELRQHDAISSSEEDFLGWESAEIAMSADEVPFQQALSGPSSDEWEDAILAEIKSLISNDTFDLVNKPSNEKIIKCRTVLRNKYGPDGLLERWKARVVAKGFAQKPGIHYFETYAPVARLSSLRSLLAVAAKFDLHVAQLDIETAYLNGRIDTDIYMEMPELLEKMLQRIISEDANSSISQRARGMLNQLKRGSTVCKLKKALYGLRQSGRQWHTALDTVLQGIGLTPTNSDPCVYIDKKELTFVLVYVDDILIISNDKKRESEIKEKLSKHFKVKDLGDARYCLGIEIIRDRESITLSQTGYINEILQRFRMSSCKPVSTPLAPGSRFDDDTDDPENEEKFPYRELIGALMYAAIGTRPDIAHAISVLGQFNHNPKRVHWTAAKRVLRCLQGSKDLGLKYWKDTKPLISYVDADWANCKIDRRSYTGSIFIFGGAAISWESRKQRTTALSSTEAEYMAITDAAKEAVYLIRFLKDLRLSKFARVTIYNDNQAAGKLAENPIFHSRSKHIDVRHHFIRQVLKDYPVDLTYLSTEKMIADALTKGLPGPKFLECISSFGLKSVSSSVTN